MPPTCRKLPLVAAVGAALAAAALAVAPAPASAAQLIDRDAQDLHLAVDGKGEALLTYRSAGQLKHVLVWGAINALPRSTSHPQVKFEVDYSGGWGKYHHQLFGGHVYWQTFHDACRAYAGPTIPNMLAACTAPDGTYWAVQQWPQPLPDLGFDPWTTQLRQQWMEVSHWSGPLAQLTAHSDWVYDGRYHDLFGNYTYHGWPVRGFHTTSYGAPTDDYGRLIYLDTYDSAYGPGWHRENSFVSHGDDGEWCYGFYQFDPTKGGYSHPPGQTAARGPGVGTQYRLFAEGPGVTPDVETLVTDPGDWNPSDPAKVAWKSQEAALLPSVVGNDKSCLAGHDF